MNITKDTVIGELLASNPEKAQYFFDMGMHCLGCPHARNETIEQACMSHGADLEALIAKLNS